MPGDRWRVLLAVEARQDFEQILARTGRQFGAAQLRRYRATLQAAVAELAGGPGVLGSKDRGDVMQGLRTLHVARKGRRGRHLLAYRVVGEREVAVLRILHDAMDPARHLPDEPG